MARARVRVRARARVGARRRARVGARVRGRSQAGRTSSASSSAARDTCSRER